MKPFLNQAEQSQVTQAIAAAEAACSGEIRVVIHPELASDPLETAKAEFVRLGMHATRERNAVLILVAPQSHTFAIYGDEAVDRLCGQSFWQEICAEMMNDFKRNAFGEGIAHAVGKVGKVLAKHFPPRADDRNELPDDVIDKGIVI